MKRIDKVYEYVKNQTQSLTASDLEKNSGVTTKEVAEACDIQRSNASKDLNSLVPQYGFP